MRRRWQSTIRVRLTLLYAGAFFVAGAILVALLYLFLAQSLSRQLNERVAYTDQLRTHEPHVVTPAVADQILSQFQQDRDNTMRTMLIASLGSLGIIGISAAGFGWLLAGRALQPLHDITATARRVADKSLKERIDRHGPDDEIKELADTFDAMLERLDRAFDSQRRFVANASHELRTPLTINRTLIEVALDNPDASESLRQLGANLLAVNQRNERLIDGLLTLAGSEQRLTEHSAVDLADIARHVTTESQDSPQARGVEIKAALQPAKVIGDPVLLERVVKNLVDNALRYNLPEGGWVRVSTGTDNGQAIVTVENTGHIVPSYEIANLFEPFRRLSSTERRAVRADQGAGLGLSIVRSVTHVHGGDVEATARADGGLTVRLRIPALAGN